MGSERHKLDVWFGRHRGSNGRCYPVALWERWDAVFFLELEPYYILNVRISRLLFNFRPYFIYFFYVFCESHSVMEMRYEIASKVRLKCCILIEIIDLFEWISIQVEI